MYMQNCIKLYLITIKDKSKYYVISRDPNTASNVLIRYLDAHDRHRCEERTIINIEVLSSETFEYPLIIADINR